MTLDTRDFAEIYYMAKLALKTAEKKDLEEREELIKVLEEAENILDSRKHYGHALAVEKAIKLLRQDVDDISVMRRRHEEPLVNTANPNELPIVCPIFTSWEMRFREQLKKLMEEESK